jgi:methionyl-tRNA synthetase
MASTAADAKPVVSYEDFAKLDFRVAKILDVQPVEGSDKLYRLKIRLGEGNEREIVSGIAGFYAPDELLGKKIIVIANLEPKKIRGLDSNGMLLAAGAQDDAGNLASLSLVTVDDASIPSGTAIS